MAGLRRTVKPPVPEDALGAGWAMPRVLLDAPGDVSGDGSFAAAVRDRLHAGLERGDAFAAYLTAEPMMRLTLGPVKQRMGELAVSYTGVAAVAPVRRALRVADLQVFVATMDVGPALVVQHRIWDGRLLGGIVYHDHDLRADTVAAIGDDVRRRLLALAVADPPGSAARGPVAKGPRA